MQIRTVGYVDEVIEVDDDLWNNAKNDEELTKVMQPYFDKLHINLTFGTLGEFDGLD